MRMRLFIALTAVAALAAPAVADEPGPGATRPLVPKTGEEVYRYVCQACHMADGKGAEGAGRFPALAGNPRLAAPAYPIFIIEKGRGGMPYFSDSLSPAQVAAVVNYIRSNFGNAYKGEVTAADVEPMAKPPKSER